MVRIKFFDGSVLQVDNLRLTASDGVAKEVADVWFDKSGVHYQGDKSTMLANEIINTYGRAEIIYNDWEPGTGSPGEIY